MTAYENQALNTLLHELDELQASDIKVIDVREQTSITDYMVIATGRSSRHTKSMAQNIMEKMKKAGNPCLSSTGLDSGDWVLLDFADFIVHIMQSDARIFYNLEGLWQDQNQ